MTAGEEIRVVLVDDQPLVRAGLRRILGTAGDIAVVGECEDGADVGASVAAAEPVHVVVMDIRMKGVDGVEATRRLRADPGSPPVLVLTTFDDDATLSAALRAGATGFALKDVAGEELIEAVRTLARGGAWLDPAVTGRVLATYRTAVPTPVDAPAVADITPREREVLCLIGRGATNAEIARELHISDTTVKTHIGHLFMKLDLRDRAAAVVFAFDHGLVSPAGRIPSGPAGAP